MANTHTIITVSLFSLAGLTFVIIHFLTIYRNIQHVEDNDDTDTPPPASILYFALVLTFWTSYGFYQNVALRKFGVKTAKSIFLTNPPKGLLRRSDRRLFHHTQVRERTMMGQDDIVIENIE